MAGEGIQNYVEMAAGLKRATKAKAEAAAKSLLASVGLEEVAADATDRATKLAEEVLAASKANRELMGKLVASEVDKAAGRLGFVRTEELDELRQELAELRMSMAHAAAHDEPHDLADPAPPYVATPFAADLGIPDPPAPVDHLEKPDEAPPIEPIEPPLAKKATAKKAPVKKAPAKKAAATTPAKKAPAKKTPAKKAPAKTTPAKKTAAKTATTTTAAKKTAAKKTAAKKTAAKKTAATTSADA